MPKEFYTKAEVAGIIKRVVQMVLSDSSDLLVEEHPKPPEHDFTFTIERTYRMKDGKLSGAMAAKALFADEFGLKPEDERIILTSIQEVRDAEDDERKPL